MAYEDEAPRTSFARKRARFLLQKFGITKPWVDPEVILTGLGYACISVPTFPEYVDALLITSPDGKKLAGFNAKHHPHRQRFSLAHELGHFQLGHTLNYYGPQVTIYNPPTRSAYERVENHLEQEANAFAGELLVPFEMLKVQFKKTRDPNELSRIFYVSTAVVSVAITHYERFLYK